jgi:phosphatidylglycerol:prolipoprotein diacylglycerol transferase
VLLFRHGPGGPCYITRVFDHPYISDPDYTTTLLAWTYEQDWWNGSLLFRESLKSSQNGFVILDVYYAAYFTVFLVAIWLLRTWQKRGSLHIEPSLCLDTVLIAVAGAAFGGRLGEAIFYNPEYFFFEPFRMVRDSPGALLTIKPWRLFTNASGMTIHGVIIGGVFAVWLWSRMIKKPFLHILDQGTIIIAFGTVLGRVANFLGGELWGRSTDLPWGTRFLLKGYLSRQVYANERGDTFMLVRETVEKDGAKEIVEHLEPWQVDQTYEVLKDQPANWVSVGAPGQAFEQVWRCVTDPRHPVVLYQALGDGLLVLVLLILIRWKTRHVGVMTASFLILYGIIRTILEKFRQPEPGLGFILGLTRGQLLSLAMVAAGLLVFAWIKRKPRLIAEIPVETPKRAQAAPVAASDSKLP